PCLEGKLHNSSSKATMIVKIAIDENEERTFALVFGRGGSLINDTTIEERFGLKTALNLIGERNIRNISKVVIGGSQKNTIEQMPRQSTIDEFEIDIDTDLVVRVTGKVTEGNFVEGNVTGSDSLLIKHDTNVSNVKSFLRDIYDCYLSKEYLKSFEWIDQVKIVKDKNLILLLDQQVVMALNQKNDDFWMALPEIIEWDTIKGFRISGVRDTIFDDIYIDKVLDSLREALVSINSLKNKQIYPIDINDQELAPWTAYKCLYGELSYSGHSYCINNGKWYEIDNDYSSKIEKQYSESIVSDIEFIDCRQGQKEEEYNLEFTKSNRDNFICLDRKLITLGKSKNPIEVCDVLSKNNQLIHVKKYSGSSVLSHLFNQGFVSATLLKKGDNDYLKKSNDEILKLTGVEDFKLVPNKQYEIVYGIISKENESLPNIPFFSKISFCNIRDKLKLYGFKCSIKSIRKQS
ncbi:MAG: DUF6119 family protein, partial [Bacilli bacterium]